jgi:hypothetical protein
VTDAAYRITVGDGRSTEELVADGRYGYAHSAVIAENFPVSRAPAPRMREIVLLALVREVTAGEALAEAARRRLVAPTYDDALHFGVAYPELQRDGPIVFLHEPWLGYFGRRDVLVLWCNAGRRELGLEGFDDAFSARHRFAFVRPGSV